MLAIVEPHNPHNIAAILRSMAAFGSEKLSLINPQCSLSDIPIEIARAGYPLIKQITILTSITTIRGVRIATTSQPTRGANLLRSPILPNDAATLADATYILGRERSGLTNEEIAQCDMCMTIPTRNEQHALNLSHAATIILYEQFLTRIASGQDHPAQQRSEPASREEKERALAMILAIHALTGAGERSERNAHTQMLVWKRILARAQSAMEVRTIMAFLAGIDGSLRRPLHEPYGKENSTSSPRSTPKRNRPSPASPQP